MVLAYHLRTNESFMGVNGSLDLDLIYMPEASVPEAGVFVGICYDKEKSDEKKIKIFNCSKEEYFEKAEEIVNKKEVIVGVCDSFNLDGLIAMDIKENGEKYDGKTIEIKRPYDMTKDTLVEILSSKIVKEGFLKCLFNGLFKNFIFGDEAFDYKGVF